MIMNWGIFTSKMHFKRRIIHVYENQTREISLLSSSCSSLRSSASTMFLMQKDLDDPAQETRPSFHSGAVQAIRSCVSGRVHPSTFGSAALPGGVARIPAPLPPNITPIRRTSLSTKDSFWTSDPGRRWALVLLSRPAMDSLSRRTEALLWRDSYFLRPFTSSRQ